MDNSRVVREYLLINGGKSTSFFFLGAATGLSTNFFIVYQHYVVGYFVNYYIYKNKKNYLIGIKMDFLQQYEKKYLPNLHSTRYKKRIQDALDLKQKTLNNPRELSWEEIRIIMRVLKYKKILPSDPKANQLQKNFITNAIGGIIPSLILGYCPYLIKQFHKIRRKGVKYGIIGSISLLVYSSIIGKPLIELNDYSREQAKKYIGQLKAGVQQSMT